MTTSPSGTATVGEDGTVGLSHMIINLVVVTLPSHKRTYGLDGLAVAAQEAQAGCWHARRANGSID